MWHKRDSNVVKRGVAGEIFLIPIRASLADLQNIYVLHGVGEFIWDRLDGETAPETIARDLVGEYEVDADRAMADVHELVGELEKAGLVSRVG